MGSVSGKTLTEPENYSFFSIIRHDKINIVYIVFYNMDEKIRSISAAFKHISNKRVELLNLWKDHSSLYNVLKFT
jgi:hypothetical protein